VLYPQNGDRIVECRRRSHYTNQLPLSLPLSSIIKSRRFTFFGHIARMDENADASLTTALTVSLLAKKKLLTFKLYCLEQLLMVPSVL